MSSNPTDVDVAFRPEDLGDVGRDFEGQVIEAVYPYEDPSSKFEGVQMRLLIRSEKYEKDQPLWLPPSRGTGTKWGLFLTDLSTTGALKLLDISGTTNTEKLQNMCRSMLGMKFHFKDEWRERPNNPKEKMKVTRFMKYLGKEVVSPTTKVTEERVQL